MNRVGLAVVFLATCAYADSNSATGSWSWHEANHAGGWLKTIQSGTTIRFQLELSRGAPSYNMGWVEGEFALSGSEGTFHSDAFGTCELHFSFKNKQVVVEEVADQCGYGYGVTAAGTYQLDSASRPVFSKDGPR